MQSLADFHDTIRPTHGFECKLIQSPDANPGSILVEVKHLSGSLHSLNTV